MALITFSGGAVLHIPGTPYQVASALSAPRDGAMFAQFGRVRVNPDQIAFISEDPRPPHESEPELPPEV